MSCGHRHIPEYREIIFSDIPYLPLKLTFPYVEMLHEAKSLADRYVDHREYENGTQGWKSVALHGLGPDKTLGFESYGISPEEQYLHYHWTDVAQECPTTFKFLRNDFPSDNFARVRFMLLKPGGRIPFHTDYKDRRLASITLALNHPFGCNFAFRTPRGIVSVPFKPGAGFALNLSYPHEVVNDSSEDRYHMIIHVLRGSDDFRKLITDSYARALDSTTYRPSDWIR